MLHWKIIRFFPINKDMLCLPSDQLLESKSDGSQLTTVNKYPVQVLSVLSLACFVTF